MSVELTAPPTLKRQYPHLEGISDWRAAQSLRLLWDRYYDLEARLQGIEATAGDLVSASNTAEDQLVRVDHKADEALALFQGSEAEKQRLGEESGVLPGGGDGGQGAAGCGAAPSTGHLPGPVDQTAYEAGRTVCGTANEYHDDLFLPVADADTRTAHALEFVLRAIWHLQQEGFTAGRQRNPSGLLSNDKLAVVVDGVTRAYDIVGMNPPAEEMSSHMVEVGSPNLVADPGLADGTPMPLQQPAKPPGRRLR